MAQDGPENTNNNPQDNDRANWEKSANPELAKLTKSGGRWKYLVGSVLIMASIGYLMVSTVLSARFYVTVDEALSGVHAGETIRLSGAVLGETINHTIDRDETGRTRSVITFTISHIPAEVDNLAEALYRSVNDPTMARLDVYYEGAKPDLLQHEAQAIVTGEIREDGVFYANELLLKCPSRFEDGGSSDTLAEDHPGMQLNAG